MQTLAPANELFTRTHALKVYLQVEAELARAQAEAGLIPLQIAEEIARCCTPENVSPEQIWNEMERTGYPIAPLVRKLTKACSEGAGQFVHWGATTMDIMDTAFALQLRDALAHIEGRLSDLMSTLSDLARTHRETVMAARTFGGHAVPITFGFKVAGWLAPFVRHMERVRQLRKRAAVCELGGAAGTLASMGEHGLAIQKIFARRLGLNPPLIVWHTARDNAAETVCVFGLVTGTLAKIAGDISLLSSTEIAEVFEPVSGGRDTSSTLPQKTNPIYSGQVMACASMVAQSSALALHAMRQQQERSSEGFIEFTILPEAFAQTIRALDKLIQVLRGLRVDPRRMRDNLKLTKGQIMAEAVMMALAPKIGRLAAHDVLHETCQQASGEDLPLLEVLRGNRRVREALSDAELTSVLEPGNYLGNARETVDTVVAEAMSSLKNQ